MRLFSSICAFALAAACLAQTTEIPGHQISKVPTIDGNIGDDEWAGVPSVQGMVDGNNAIAPEQAQFWIAYDADYVYFAARMQDPSPNQIRANEYRTNVSLSGDDSVYLAIDLTGTGTDVNYFQVNPRGATSIELAGGRAAKREWTGEFLAKGRVTETGWEAEARVPWQVMRLPGAGKRNLRVNFGRFVSRSQRSFQHINMETDVRNCPTWAGVMIPAQAKTRSLKLLPYSYFGYDPDSGHVFNSGLDLKTQLSDQIELVGTINPDFRNIENQVLSLDFSRFERLAGETRPFFQEGMEYIGSAIFASQRIDNFDVGLNTYGRLSNKTSFGLMNITDFDRRNFLGLTETKGTRNNLIATVNHNPDPSLTTRLAVTSVDRPDLKNDSYLFRATKDFGDFILSGRQMASRDSITGYGKFQDVFLEYQRNGWSNYVSYAHVEPRFNPRLGFFPDTDYKGWEMGVNYNKNFDKGFLNDYGFYVGGLTFEHTNGDFYRNQISINPFTTLRGGLAIVGLAEIGQFEGTLDELYGVNIGYPRGNPYRNIGVSYFWGRQAGVAYNSLSASLAYRMFGRLQTNVRFQRVNYQGTQDQVVASASYDLGKDRSIAGRLVRQEDDTNFYLALRQSGNLGTEYFLILGDPNARSFRSSLILKVTVPFEIPLGGSKKPKAQPEKQILSGQDRDKGI